MALKHPEASYFEELTSAKMLLVLKRVGVEYTLLVGSQNALREFLLLTRAGLFVKMLVLAALSCAHR